MLERVEIAGCIASGKTTLAKALGRRFKTIYEDHKINPFCKAFYTDTLTYAFETEITFLLQHYHFAKVAAMGSRTPLVLDHSFELDLAYARVGLDGPRLGIFESIYREIESELGPPRAVILISCASEVLVKRIQERGRSLEAGIQFDFLSNLQCELEKRVDELQGEVEVIRVDSERTDFRKEGGWLTKLVSMVGSRAQ